VLPREILGISTFSLSIFLLRWLPIKQVDSLILFFSRFILGETEKYGLPRPKTGPLQIKSKTGKTPVLDIGALRKIAKSERRTIISDTLSRTALSKISIDPASQVFLSL
jgi:indole-3-pyruvate monooxygenase